MLTIELPCESLAVDFASHLAWVSSVHRQHNLCKCTYLGDMQLLEEHMCIISFCNDKYCSVVSPRLDDTFMASQTILFEMELFFI